MYTKPPSLNKLAHVREYHMNLSRTFADLTSASSRPRSSFDQLVALSLRGEAYHVAAGLVQAHESYGPDVCHAIVRMLKRVTRYAPDSSTDPDFIAYVDKHSPTDGKIADFIAVARTDVAFDRFNDDPCN